MILKGQVRTNILKIPNGTVNLCEDKPTDSYSIGLTTNEGFEWKFISKELHDLLVEELSEQEGKGFSKLLKEG